MRNKKDINLQEYSKSDLIWVIERLNVLGQNYMIRIALDDLDFKKTKERLQKCDAICEEASECRRRYGELMKPYVGKSIREVPKDVLDEATRMIDRAQKLDKEWTRLIKQC